MLMGGTWQDSGDVGKSLSWWWAFVILLGFMFVFCWLNPPSASGFLMLGWVGWQTGGLLIPNSPPICHLTYQKSLSPQLSSQWCIYSSLSSINFTLSVLIMSKKHYNWLPSCDIGNERVKLSINILGKRHHWVNNWGERLFWWVGCKGWAAHLSATPHPSLHHEPLALTG
jgi:hypothetical protein